MLRPGTDRKYPFLLLLAAGAVLAIGLVLKPNAPAEKQPPSQTELAQLQRLTQQRRLRDLSSYLSDAAAASASSLVTVRPGNHSGVVWGSGAVVVTTKAHPEDDGNQYAAVTPDGRSLPLHRLSLQYGVPFSAFSFGSQPKGFGVSRAPKAPGLGDWVLAVARNAEGAVVFAHGLYQGMATARCGTFAYRSIQSSAPLSTGLLGGGAFTLNGELLGIISECDQHPVVIALESVAAVLRQPPSMNRDLEDYYGIRIAEDTAAGAAPPKSTIRVIAVWGQSRAEKAGLRPGDVIVAADEQSVQAREDLEALISHHTVDHQLTVLRGRRRIRITLSADKEIESQETPYGLTVSARPEDGHVEIAAVAAQSSAARAGVLRGDVLLRVGSAAVTNATAAIRELQDSKTPRVLTLERDGRRYEVLLQP